MLTIVLIKLFLQNIEIPTTLMMHFFGRKGKDTLKFEDFQGCAINSILCKFFPNKTYNDL